MNKIISLENLSRYNDNVQTLISEKQDVISDLNDIRSGAALGTTALQEHQDISHLATKESVEDLKNKVIVDEEVYAAAVNDLNTRIITADTLLSTEITNREALQIEVQTINTNILENEEIIAATLTDLNSQIASLNAIIAELTTRIETLENA